LGPPLLPLLEQCFQREPRDRLTAAELLDHPYVISGERTR